MTRLRISVGLLLATSLFACQVPSSGTREHAGPKEQPAPEPAPPTTTTPAKPEINGPGDEAVILEFVSDQFYEIQGCYEAALPRKPELEGVVTIKFTIDDDGKVTQAEALDGDAFGGPRAVACMLRAVNRWKFPSEKLGGPAEVTYPFELTSDLVRPAETLATP